MTPQEGPRARRQGWSSQKKIRKTSSRRGVPFQGGSDVGKCGELRNVLGLRWDTEKD
jgi:hypothetical protein